MPKGWVFLLLVNGKSTCRPSKYDKLFGDENEPPFQTDITNCLTKMFRVFPHFSSFGLIYARSCQNISLEYDWNYKNRSLGSYLGCCQDIFKIRNSPNPDQIYKFIIRFHSRCMSDPLLSDIDFKNKLALVWTTLNGKLTTTIVYQVVTTSPLNWW